MIYVADREILYADIYAYVGESVTILCRRSDLKPVLWQYKHSKEQNVREVYDGKHLYSSYVTKCTINNSTYDLTILEAEVNDTGEYWCTEDEGFGVKHVTKLYVTGMC